MENKVLKKQHKIETYKEDDRHSYFELKEDLPDNF